MQRKSNILQLIHSVLGDFHSTPLLVDKKYIIIFFKITQKIFMCIYDKQKDEVLIFFSLQK